MKKNFHFQYIFIQPSKIYFMMLKPLPKEIIQKVKKQTGAKGKDLFMPIRVSITGTAHGPDLGKIFILISKESIIMRINKVLEELMGQ